MWVDLLSFLVVISAHCVLYENLVLLLKDYEVEEFGKQLDRVHDWRRTADWLGLTDDEKRQVEAMTDCVPTVEVLRIWSKKHRSTVRILRQMLVEEASPEFVQMLDDLRKSKYM